MTSKTLQPITEPQTPATPPKQESRVVLGFLIALSAHFSLALAQFFMKKVQPKISSFQVQYIIFIQMAVYNYILCCRNNFPIYFTKPQINRLTILRGILGIIGSTGLLYSLNKLSLSEVIVISNTSPVITNILAIIFLKETLDLPLALNAILSMAGVLFIAQPGFLFSSNQVTVDRGSLALGFLCASISAICGGIAPLVLKTAGKYVKPITLSYFFGFVVSILAPIGMFSQSAVPLNFKDFMMLLIGGITMTAGQVLWAKSALYAEASRLSMALYSQTIFAYILEIVVDQIYPDEMKIIGTLFILSGFFVLLQKAVRQSKEKTVSK